MFWITQMTILTTVLEFLCLCCWYLYDLFGAKLYDFKCHELMENEQKWT